MQTSHTPERSVYWIRWCILGVLVSFFLSGTLSVFFSSNYLETWIENKVNRPDSKFTIQVDGVHVRLSQWGVIPVFHLHVEFGLLKFTKTCMKETSLIVEKVNIPLKWSSFFEKKLNISATNVEKLSLDISSHSCTVNPKEFIGSSGVMTRFLTSRWEKEVLQLAKSVESLHIKQIQVHNKNDQLVVLKKLFIQPLLATSSVILSTQFVLKKFNKIKSLSHLFNLQILISGSKISARLKGHVEEGLINISGNLLWKKKRGLISFTSHGFLSHIPFTSLWNLLYAHKIVSAPFPNVTAWVTCGVEVQFIPNQVKDSGLLLKECRLAGDEGVVVLSPVSLQFPDLRITQKEFTVNMKKLSIHRVLNNLLDDYYQRHTQFIYFNRGYLTGDVVVKQNQGRLQAVVHQLETSFYFKQKLNLAHIETAKLNIDWDKARANMLLQGIEMLPPHHLSGTLKLSKDFKNNLLHLRVKDMRWSIRDCCEATQANGYISWGKYSRFLLDFKELFLNQTILKELALQPLEQHTNDENILAFQKVRFLKKQKKKWRFQSQLSDFKKGQVVNRGKHASTVRVYGTGGQTLGKFQIERKSKQIGQFSVLIDQVKTIFSEPNL